MEPKKVARPKVKMPPSAATNQHPVGPLGAIQSTLGLLVGRLMGATNRRRDAPQV